MTHAGLALLAAAAVVATSQPVHPQRSPREIVVDPQGPVSSLGAAVAMAPGGATIVLRPGVYREATIRLTRPVTIDGGGSAVLDGGGTQGLLVVVADDVTIRGLVLRHTGTSRVDDRAALLVEGASNCRVEQNRVERSHFGIYLARTTDCAVIGNAVDGAGVDASLAGNGIHVWQSERVTIANNTVRGHRDGVYFEFVKAGTVRRNVSEANDRYGLHFMFSDDCRYEANTFRANGAGVAVMYTRRVQMVGNRFERNWGSAAYGLLLKDILDSEIVGNEFVGNSTALYLEGSNRNRVDGNTFAANGWALRILANAQQNEITDNDFLGNSFDVGTNSRQNFSTFRGNHWDRYRGYDLDRDGFGDVPHPPVRLFALVVEQSPPALILLRSLFVDVLDLAERVMPSLTPRTLIDERPRMTAAAPGPRVTGESRRPSRGSRVASSSPVIHHPSPFPR
jgi:nitrous oxidase accessory protein